MLNMAERILWDEYEAAILLDALIQVLNGTISRSDAVSAVSAAPAHMLPRRVIHAPPIISGA